MTTNQAKRRRIWAWTGAGVALACAVINGGILWHTTSRWQQIDQREQEIASIQKDLDELASLQKALDEFKAEAHGDMRGLDHDAKRQQLKQKLDDIEQRLAKLSGNTRRAE